MSSQHHLNQSEYPRKSTTSTIEHPSSEATGAPSLASPWGFQAHGNGQSEQARRPVESRPTGIACARELEIQGLVYTAIGALEDAQESGMDPDYRDLISVLTRVVTRLSSLVAERAGHSTYVAVPQELWERVIRAVCVAGGRAATGRDSLSDSLSSGDVQAFAGELADELAAGGVK